jgi:hypothetical protein
MVGLAAALLAPGCKSGAADGPAPEPGAAAGEVVELTGTATAARPGEEFRSLVVGAEVWGDDTVTTGATSAVAIRLRHNNAEWRLEGDRSRRVDQSVAWNAPRQESGGAFDGDDPADRTAAAGRHSEREAASTRATAAADEEAASPPAAAVEPEPAAEPPAPRKKARRRPRPSPSPATADVPSRSFESAPAAAPPPAPAARDDEATPRPAPRRPAKTRGSSGAADPAATIRGKIRVCHALAEDAPGGVLKAVVTIGAGNKVTKAVVTAGLPGLEPVAACARAKLLGLVIAGAGPGIHRVSVDLR